MSTEAQSKVQPTYYEQLLEKAKQIVGTSLQIPNPVPVELGGQGQFPYNWKDGNDNFTEATYRWLNAVAAPGKSGAIAFPEPFSDRYEGLLSDLSWSFDAADEAKYNAARLAAEEQERELVSGYERLFGEITEAEMEAAKVKNKLDFVIQYQVCTQWPTSPPLRIEPKTVRELAKLLGKMPPSAGSLVGTIEMYLTKVQSALSLINEQTAGQFTLATLLGNTQSPSLENGGMRTSDKAIHVGFDVSPAPALIDQALQESSSLTISLDVHEMSSTTMHVSVDGSAEAEVDTGFLVKIGGSVEASYDLYELNTDSAEVKVSMTFPGLTGIYVTPTEYQEDTQTGWYYPAPIREAVENEGREVSGYKFTSKPKLTFGEGGDFGLVNALIISRLPTITIRYSSGEASEKTKSLSGKQDLEISVFGIGLASESLSYSSSEIKESGKDEGFEITFSPPAAAGAATEQVAYVIGAGVAYPGATKS
jgi:hypothetical protein